MKLRVDNELNFVLLRHVELSEESSFYSVGDFRGLTHLSPLTTGYITSITSYKALLF